MTANRRLHLIYQSVRDRKMLESEKVRQVKKVFLFFKSDWIRNYAELQAISHARNQIKTWANSKNERAANVKAKMLLAWEEALFPAKYSSRCLFIWKSNSGLLPKDWRNEKKSVNFKRKRRTRYRGAKMCLAKLRASQTVMTFRMFWL